ncbi:MAG: ADP-ribosyltransferase [Propionibacteriaceae bacterium]
MLKDTETVFNGGRERAITIARTEALDAYRAATHEEYTANADILDGWVWVSEPGACLVCLAMGGTVHRLDETGPLDHPRGRCSREPKFKPMKGFKDPTPLPTGEELLKAMPQDEQRRILGPARYEAWKNGTSLSAMVERGTNPGWRDSYKAVPVDRLPKPVVYLDKSAEFQKNGAVKFQKDAIAFRKAHATADQNEAIKFYTRDGYRLINDALRGHESTPMIYEKISDMRSMFLLGIETPEPVVLYRGLGLGSIPAKGEVFSDPAFFSTSLNRETSREFAQHSSGSNKVLFKISAPAGTPYIPGTHWEAELILAPSTEFRILTDPIDIGDGIVQIEMEMI